MTGPIFDEASSSNAAASLVETDGSTGSEERRWGKTFPIEWIRTTPLSFKRVQHLRDSRNHNVGPPHNHCLVVDLWLLAGSQNIHGWPGN